MLESLSDTTHTLLFLGVVVCLGAAFIWAFWEIEQASNARRSRLRRPTRAH